MAEWLRKLRGKANGNKIRISARDFFISTEALAWPRRLRMKQSGEISSGWALLEITYGKGDDWLTEVRSTARIPVKRLRIRWVQEGSRDESHSKSQGTALWMPGTVRLRRDETVENVHVFKPVGGKKWWNHIVLQKILTGKGVEGRGSCGVKWEAFSGHLNKSFTLPMGILKYFWCSLEFIAEDALKLKFGVGLP